MEGRQPIDIARSRADAGLGARLELPCQDAPGRPDPLTVEIPFMRGTRESSFLSAYRASWTIDAPEGTRIWVRVRSEKGGEDAREVVLRSSG